MTWLVKIAGSESVISRVVVADGFTVIGSLVIFYVGDVKVFAAGGHRVISIEPEAS